METLIISAVLAVSAFWLARRLVRMVKRPHCLSCCDGCGTTCQPRKRCYNSTGEGKSTAM